MQKLNASVGIEVILLPFSKVTLVSEVLFLNVPLDKPPTAATRAGITMEVRPLYPNASSPIERSKLLPSFAARKSILVSALQL